MARVKKSPGRPSKQATSKSVKATAGRPAKQASKAVSATKAKTAKAGRPAKKVTKAPVTTKIKAKAASPAKKATKPAVKVTSKVKASKKAKTAVKAKTGAKTKVKAAPKKAAAKKASPKNPALALLKTTATSLNQLEKVWDKQAKTLSKELSSLTVKFKKIAMARDKAAEQLYALEQSAATAPAKDTEKKLIKATAAALSASNKAQDMEDNMADSNHLQLIASAHAAKYKHLAFLLQQDVVLEAVEDAEEATPAVKAKKSNKKKASTTTDAVGNTYEAAQEHRSEALFEEAEAVVEEALTVDHLTEIEDFDFIEEFEDETDSEIIN